MVQRVSPLTSGRPQTNAGFREFVSLIAALMAVNALAIDMILPALPAMGAALNIRDANHQQWAVAAYVVGFGIAQLFYGPLGDRFGRKAVLLPSLVLFVLTSLAVTMSRDLETMLAARVLQGVAAASGRVLTVSIVRDRYRGRQMARVMSLSFIVFLAVPILAPSLGQLILLAGPWRWIFYALAIYATIVLIWATMRLPETLREENRRKLTVRKLAEAGRCVVTDRTSLGYMLAYTLVFGGQLGFIVSVQQIFADVLRAEIYFAPVFAGTAAFMIAAAYLNSRIVERIGTRRVSHTALLAMIAISAAHLLAAALSAESLLRFAAFQALTLFCYGLIGPNLGAMAMEPLGRIAGTASSIQGFVSTLGAAVIAMAIGQSYNHSVVPLATGYFIVSLLAIAAVSFAEKGRLFQDRGAITRP